MVDGGKRQKGLTPLLASYCHYLAEAGFLANFEKVSRVRSDQLFVSR